MSKIKPKKKRKSVSNFDRFKAKFIDIITFISMSVSVNFISTFSSFNKLFKLVSSVRLLFNDLSQLQWKN